VRFYQISNSDDCGGFGDRLSGVFGASLLALSTGRSLLLDWTGADDWLEPNVVDWRPDEVRRWLLATHAQHIDRAKSLR
jgi:hypothetical protein